MNNITSSVIELDNRLRQIPSKRISLGNYEISLKSDCNNALDVATEFTIPFAAGLGIAAGKIDAVEILALVGLVRRIQIKKIR